VKAAELLAICTVEWNKPKEDGSHLMKVWNTLNGQLWTDLDIKNHEVIDTLRAWKGRDQTYACTFKQDKLGFYKQIKCPILAMCSKEDVLWPNFHYCSELVGIILSFSDRECANLLCFSNRLPELR